MTEIKRLKKRLLGDAAMKPPDWLTDEGTRCYVVPTELVGEVCVHAGVPYAIVAEAGTGKIIDFVLGHIFTKDGHAEGKIGSDPSPDPPYEEAWKRLREQQGGHEPTCLGIQAWDIPEACSCDGELPPDGRYFLVKREKECTCGGPMEEEDMSYHAGCRGTGKVTHHELVPETATEVKFKTTIRRVWVDCSMYAGSILRFISKDGQRWDVRRE